MRNTRTIEVKEHPHGENDTEIITEIITFRGLVQGVGFRPTVYRIAQQFGMKGRVRNMGGIVQIVCSGTSEEIDLFIREINHRKPPMARISGVSRKRISTAVFHEFSIGQSGDEEDEIAVLPTDIAICDDCLREFYDPDDLRYQHPFISCTNCGPRYTIMKNLPYDRDTTTMDDFPMCDFCTEAYTDPASRRYHAQTISCHDCGPQPIFVSSAAFSGQGKSQRETVAKTRQNTDYRLKSLLPAMPVQAAAGILGAGGIIALKGVGGYYLVCTPFNGKTVHRLRAIKRREQKPFAIMFRNIEQIREYCVVQAQEEAALLSPGRPIILLEQRPDRTRSSRGIKGDDSSVPPGTRLSPPPELAPEVNSASRFVGAFLPSAGLQYLLLDASGPLIMTSANLSDLPLITDDDEMAEMAAREPFIRGILYNERRIAAGLDDSVARVVDGEVQLIRRSKGYVPAPVYVQSADILTKETKIFAAGAHLKSAFALSKGPYAYLSRHLGDIDSIESENIYHEAFERMKALFEIEPGLAVCDLHPRYFPTRFAEGLRLPLIYAQHHHAHIASVMAEHGLRDPVIGVAFDGTGYGTDGRIWGGEVLICEGADFERFSHLQYTDMIGGDDSMKDAWKSAVSFLYTQRKAPAPDGIKVGGQNLFRRLKESRGDHLSTATARTFEIDLTPFIAYSEKHHTLALTHPPQEQTDVETAIRLRINTVQSSSMGRLFDAVCVMLGIHDENRYEGECAILLENEARRALRKQQFSKRPTEREQLALAFHKAVSQIIVAQCQRARDERGLHKVCLSGGVFQNKILMEETLRLLRGDCFTVYYNMQVPPNDGGIALGQTYIGMTSVAREIRTSPPTSNAV